MIKEEQKFILQYEHDWTNKHLTYGEKLLILRHRVFRNCWVSYCLLTDRKLDKIHSGVLPFVTSRYPKFYERLLLVPKLLPPILSLLVSCHCTWRWLKVRTPCNLCPLQYISWILKKPWLYKDCEAGKEEFSFSVKKNIFFCRHVVKIFEQVFGLFLYT